MFGKKRLLKTEYERMLDIIYKCLDRSIVGMDDFTIDNISVISSIE